MEEYLTNSNEETILVARKFAKTLKPGDVVLLDGDLGAGKTVFSKGVVFELSGGKEIAVSPTFVIVNEYKTNPTVYHFDLYRISDESELYAIGIEEYLYSDAICLVEWPTRIEGIFPENSIKVNIFKVDDNKRRIEIER